MKDKFGLYTVDRAVFELRCDGVGVAIEPQVFNLLLHLIDHRDQVVSKEQLITALWGGRAISDTTLSSRVFALRRAVGDTGEAQAVIQTVPRRGFRFVATLSEREDCAVADIAEPSANEPLAPRPVVPAETKPIHRPTEQPTLMVLPFKNASAGLDEYFCDGLTEDIVSNLTHFSDLRVIAAGSSFQFKNRAQSLREIAARLQAGYIVDGSVRRDGKRLRIAVQLMDANTGVSLWADRYDREMADIFAVQDAVTHMIVASLGIKVQNAALTRALHKSPAELDAYDCLLRARRYTATLNEATHAEARDLLEQAIKLDPNYAEAYALLANVYLAEHRFDANPRPNPVDRALKMALLATELDPQNAYAHCWLAIVHFFRKDNRMFEAEAKRALDLNPNDPEILADIGHFYAFMGAFRIGVDLSYRAQQLNPLHPGWYHFAAARLHYHEKHYQKMLEDVERISMPSFYWTHLLKAAALGQLDDPSGAASLAEMHRLKPELRARDEMSKWNVAPKHMQHLMEGLLKAGLAE